MADDGFYRAFEDRYRGSREEISNRLKIYLPFIEPLRQIYDECTLVDMGCGRGEWLELVKHAGFDEVGLDLDDYMLNACSEAGLNAIHANVMEYLLTIADESVVVISGIHFIEHVSFDDAKKITKEALRVLKPGGILILETPNSENISVGTNTFYLDPTHQQPLPSLLLEFLTEYYQFSRVKVLRMQESPGLHNKENIELIDTLTNVSRDYAVVAQKVAPPQVLSLFDSPFKQDYGLTLEDVAHLYDEQQKIKYDQLSSRLNSIEALPGKIELQVAELTSNVEQSLDSLGELLNRLDSKLSDCLQAIQKGNGDNHDTMLAMCESQTLAKNEFLEMSGKIGKMEFAIGELVNQSAINNQNILELKSLISSIHLQTVNEVSGKSNSKVTFNLPSSDRFINRFSPILSSAMKVALNNSSLRKISNKILSKYPLLADKLFKFALKENLMRVNNISEELEDGANAEAQLETGEEERLSKMSLSAQNVYLAAKLEIKRLQAKEKS